MIGLVETQRRGAGPAAFDVEQLFALHEPRLGAFLAQLVRDRDLAEDLLQETFASAYRDRDQLASVERAEAWLFAIARNRAVDALRRRTRLRRTIARLASRSEPSVTVEPAVVEVMDVLERVLTPDDRALVVLRYVHGFDASAIAEMTGRSPAAVRKRLERARGRLAAEVTR